MMDRYTKIVPFDVGTERPTIEYAEQLEVEKSVLREGIIRALQIPIGAVLDRDTRLALTDALHNSLFYTYLMTFRQLKSNRFLSPELQHGLYHWHLVCAGWR